jgi:polyisoprenoid-binding protein YceI
MLKSRPVVATIVSLVWLAALASPAALAQNPGRRGAPPPDPKKPQKLEITQGTTARYKVTEQLAGISFPSDAVGTTSAITGAIIINPDGTFAPESKITVDLKALTSDQGMRDNYIQGRTLETAKFPLMEVVPKKAVGLPSPLPSGNQAQVGFQLVTDVTLHGVTKEVTWNTIAVLGPAQVGGRALATIDFAMFNMTKPSLARLLSVDDKIHLEIEFRCTRTAM